MRSESTSAFGQPSETNPTLAARPLERFEVVLTVLPFLLAAARLGLVAFLAGFIRGLGVASRPVRAAGEIGERKVSEEVAGLLLQLRLHFHERVGALLEVAAHQALDRWTLHLQEIAPRVAVEHGILAVDLPRLILEPFLDFDERVDILFE